MSGDALLANSSGANLCTRPGFPDPPPGARGLGAWGAGRVFGRAPGLFANTASTDKPSPNPVRNWDSLARLEKTFDKVCERKRKENQLPEEGEALSLKKSIERAHNIMKDMKDQMAWMKPMLAINTGQTPTPPGPRKGRG